MNIQDERYLNKFEIGDNIILFGILKFQPPINYSHLYTPTLEAFDGKIIKDVVQTKIEPISFHSLLNGFAPAILMEDNIKTILLSMLGWLKIWKTLDKLRFIWSGLLKMSKGHNVFSLKNSWGKWIDHKNCQNPNNYKCSFTIRPWGRQGFVKKAILSLRNPWFIFNMERVLL